ncbi:MAG: small-conductance mechanosensitive channel [Flavobacteriales bacterium]|jgi:small-conductance mechanosensitive channel
MSLTEIVQYKIVQYGEHSVTVFDLIQIALIFLVVQGLVIVIGKALKRAVRSSDRIDEAKRYTVLKLVKYVLYTLGLALALQSVGVNLNALLFGSAALLVGLGLGIQHIFNDMVSGLFILFEGIVKVGDVVEIEGMIARVMHIDIRTTKVVNRDGNYLIVPNSHFTSNKLHNWSMENKASRFQIEVGVAYGSDTKLVKRILTDCAQEHSGVLAEKPVRVDFIDFGESSLNFRIYFWAFRSWEIDVDLSDIRFAIDEAFRENGISIPFPQRDLHIKSGFPQVQS